MISLLELFLIVIIFLLIAAFGAFMFLARGLAWTAMMARLKGKFLLLICKRTRQLAAGAVDVKFGVARTKKSGSFNILPDNTYYNGISIGICPEDVGFNVSPEHGQVAEEMEKRGISEIKDIADTDEYGRVKNLKDDPRIKEPVKIEPRTTDFNSLYRYVQKASHPAGQDANIDLGIAQGVMGLGQGKLAWLVGAGILIFFVCIGVMVLRMHSQPTINLIVENVFRENIPVIVA